MKGRDEHQLKVVIPLSAIIPYKPKASSTSSVLAEKQQKEVFVVFSEKSPQLRSESHSLRFRDRICWKGNL